MQLADFVGRKSSPQWGMMRYAASLKGAKRQAGERQKAQAAGTAFVSLAAVGTVQAGAGGGSGGGGGIPPATPKDPDDGDPLARYGTTVPLPKGLPFSGFGMVATEEARRFGTGYAPWAAENAVGIAARSIGLSASRAESFFSYFTDWAEDPMATQPRSLIAMENILYGNHPLANFPQSEHYDDLKAIGLDSFSPETYAAAILNRFFVREVVRAKWRTEPRLLYRGDRRTILVSRQSFDVRTLSGWTPDPQEALKFAAADQPEAKGALLITLVTPDQVFATYLATQNLLPTEEEHMLSSESGRVLGVSVQSSHAKEKRIQSAIQALRKLWEE